MDAVVGVVLVVEVVALIAVVAVRGNPAGLRIVADVGGVFGVGRLLFAPALVAVVALVALFRLVALVPGVAAVRERAKSAGLRTAFWAEWGLAWPVTVFVLARLNGIGHVGPLVAMYALTSAVALGVAEDRVTVRAGHPRLPLAFGAAVGIVPWGIIAFRQVSGLVGGDPAAPVVVVITLVALALQAVSYVLAWRETDASAGETRRTVFGAVAASVLAWLVVLGVG